MNDLDHHELQGFLFAVVSAPEMIPPSEWIPVAFGGEQPEFDSTEQARQFVGDMMELYNRLNAEVFEDQVQLPQDCRFRDDVLSNFSDDAPISRWSRGFIRGHSWLEESWTGYVPDELDEELGALIMTLSFFASRELAEGFQAELTQRGKSLADMAQTVRTLFPEAMAGYAHLGRSIHQVLTEQLLMEQEAGPPQKKVGRNVPCPCGSGNKFKHCCGNPAAN